MPFATLTIFAISSFLYVYTDESVFQSAVTNAVPIWAKIVLLFSHAGYWHYIGNMEYFMPLSLCVELLSRYKSEGFPFTLAYLAPLTVYLLTGYLGHGFGISTLVGTITAGVWGYLYVLYRTKTSGMTSIGIASLGIVSGMGGVGVITGYAFPLVFSIPFNSVFTYEESIGHLFPAALSWATCYFLWNRRISAARGL